MWWEACFIKKMKLVFFFTVVSCEKKKIIARRSANDAPFYYSRKRRMCFFLNNNDRVSWSLYYSGIIVGAERDGHYDCRSKNTTTVSKNTTTVSFQRKFQRRMFSPLKKKDEVFEQQGPSSSQRVLGKKRRLQLP